MGLHRTVPLVALLLAACSRSLFSGAVPPGAADQRFSQRHATSAYRVLHSFGNGEDGSEPVGGLTVARGEFYGTTYGGGKLGVGSIYEIGTSGNERVIHSFNFSDGARPEANMILVGGALYGTTETGGAHGFGAAFKVLPTGKEQVVYSLRGGNNGEDPLASLSTLNGTFFGTAYAGGGGCGYVGCGAVFTVSAAGIGRVLYRLGRAFGRPSAPANPYGALTPWNGVLYGTTFSGGDSDLGSVYRITTSGRLRVLHSFSRNGTDGWWPEGNLTLFNSTLYGTTNFGGTGSCSGAGGCGTVFAMTADGTESVVYSFQGGADGWYPVYGLTLMNGKLYGTTSGGGTYSSVCPYGCGTVFSITPDGQKTVLHNFLGGSDGAGSGPLTAYRGTLYGITGGGGSYNEGTVFALRP